MFLQLVCWYWHRCTLRVGPWCFTQFWSLNWLEVTKMAWGPTDVQKLLSCQYWFPVTDPTNYLLLKVSFSLGRKKPCNWNVHAWGLLFYIPCLEGALSGSCCQPQSTNELQHVWAFPCCLPLHIVACTVWRSPSAAERESWEPMLVLASALLSSLSKAKSYWETLTCKRRLGRKKCTLQWVLNFILCQLCGLFTFLLL